MTLWSDVSQYQARPVDDSYPHPFFSFRTNSGSTRDVLALDNARRAKAMLDSGKLSGVFAYYFFRPGQANCDLHKQVLEEAGLWGHPLLCTMVDVEDAGGVYRSDMSVEINDEVQRLQGWYGDKRRVFGYLNGVANAGLWRTIPEGLLFVTPSYSGKPGVWASTPPPAWLQQRSFAQQFTDAAQTAPWPGGTDLNYSSKSVTEIQELLGLVATQGGSPVGAVEDGAGQLRNGFKNVRKPVDAGHLPSSFRDEHGPWPNDMWAAIVNEVVWDGFTERDDWAEIPATHPRSLVGLVLTLLARLKRVETKLDKLLEGTK